MKHINTLVAALSAVLYILPMQAKQITQQQARQQAAAFMQQHGMTVATGATSMAKSVVTGTTSATGTTADAAYYAFNDESGKGFVIPMTGIEEASTESDDNAPYYTIQGFRLDARPTLPGVYIRKGKTVVVK